MIDPKDGRIPALTPEGARRAAESGANWVGAPNGPEDRSLGERCIMGFNAGPPMAPSAYNNNVHILQTANHVSLLNEMIHNARIVPFDSRVPPPPAVRLWAGYSRARWDGNTLVLETTNFRQEGTGQVALRGMSGDQIEADREVYPRRRRTCCCTNSPSTTRAPGCVRGRCRLPMTLSEEPIYEYACHEGNYGMMNMLSGARAKDAAGSTAPQAAASDAALSAGSASSTNDLPI